MWALGICWALLGFLGAGSAQLHFKNITTVEIDNCNSSIIIPCIVIDLEKNDIQQMFVKWTKDTYDFFLFNGYPQPTIQKNSSFGSAEFVDMAKLPSGIASLRLSKKEAVPGKYNCEVIESNRNGEITVELKQKAETWFQPVENVLIILTTVLANILYWTQLGFVARKYGLPFPKMIILIIAGLVITIATVIGSILLTQDGFQTSNQVGLGLIILPAIILVPLLYILLQIVFENPPYIAAWLLILKSLGFVIAVTGFSMSVSACPPQQAPVIVAGLAVIDLAAVIALAYVIVIGSNFKDHQPPREIN